MSLPLETRAAAEPTPTDNRRAEESTQLADGAAPLLQLAQATQDAEKAEKPERAAAPAAAKTPSAEEIVQAITLRAQRELARRRARKWSISTLTTWTAGDESNPNLTKKHATALFSEEYASATFSYKLLPALTWQSGYSLDAFHYDEFTDLSTLTNSLTTKLIYRLAKPLRVEAHYSYDDSDYPYDEGSSTWTRRSTCACARAS